MSFSKESSRLFGFVAGIKFPKMIQKVINENYVKYFNINMSEFKAPCEYESLNALLQELCKFQENLKKVLSVQVMVKF